MDSHTCNGSGGEVTFYHLPACERDVPTFLTGGVDLTVKMQPEDKSPGVLKEADSLINGDRQKAYGKPEDNFRRWMNLCAATERPRIKDLTMSDLAYLMVLGKIARETASHKLDNQVDGCAYFELYERLLRD